MFLTLCYSCSGEHPATAANDSDQTVHAIIGDTVAGLGKDVGCILQDKYGNYWFASNGEGVFRYDGRAWVHFSNKQGLCSEYVFKIQEDTNGYLWFTTRDGVCCYNGKMFVDFTYAIKSAPFRKLNYAEGGLFFGHPVGVCFYDGESFSNFLISPKEYLPSQSDMSRPYDIYSTLVDDHGNVWFGTQSEGVCRYDGATFFYLKGKNLAGPAVRAICQDHSGNLWFGNNGGGLYRYDGNVLTNITDENALGNPEFLKGRYSDKPGSLARVWKIVEDNQGELWIGTIDAGVWRYDGKTLKNYTTSDGLTGNSIWEIYKDRTGRLLFVTDGEKVSEFNGGTFSEMSFE
ncbi:MAG: hypothetical protein RL213_1144 [Bacteroidota bacterium]